MFGLIPVFAVITQRLALKKIKDIKKKNQYVTFKHYTDQLKIHNTMHNFPF